MNEQFINFTIVDNTEKTEEQVLEFVKLLQKDWNVVENFSYKNRYFFVLVKHSHDLPEGKEMN